jgi:ABC-type multidrug transport system fused ATPase/permease subunit
MIASSYPLLDVFWTMVEVFFFFIWIMLLFYVFADIFRSHDMGGGLKTVWVIFIIILPFLGVFVYVIARGGSMHQRQAQAVQQQQAAMDAYVKDVAGSSSTADQLAKLAELKDKGTLTEAEFAAEKAKLLA